MISEIHYNPPEGDESLEFVEISNDATTPEDLSGCAFVEGITFLFAAGTILEAGASVVVCADADAVRARYGIDNAVGNFAGVLDGNGERLTLVDQSGIVLASLRYRDRGRWPVAPDGTGHTLSLRGIHLDPTEPESWVPSAELGGTPGRPNFPGPGPAFVDTVLVDGGDLWRYRKGTGPFSTPDDAWRAPGFDDSSWPEGPSGFGYGDGDDATVLDDMQNGYVTLAVRKTFFLAAEDLADSGADFFLAIDFDDGFCAFLNGAEVARVNCGEPGGVLGWNETATSAREAGTEVLFVVARETLVEGENLLAVQGHNVSAGSSDFSLIPRLLRRRPIEQGGGVRPALELNELFRGESAGLGWVEIYNRDVVATDLSGLRLTDARGTSYVVPPGTVLAPQGFLVLTEAETALELSTPEVRLFLLAESGVVLAAAAFSRAQPPGAAAGGFSELRFPDGAELDWVSMTPTPGAANELELETDVVINEIFYNPPQGRPGEFIELYNRGDRAVDLSGCRFDRGIDYTFAEGTVLGPGEYLVLAREPEALLESHGLSAVLGPYNGTLSNGGESVRLVDRLGNPLDEVRYEDGGKWSHWADGGGSSLELIDPFQDNSVPSAWAGSDETEKAEWEELSFFVEDYIPAAESELHIYLGSRGTCLIDEVSIRRDGGANHIPQAGFENGTAPWRIQGTHVGTRQVTHDSFAGLACLELNASGKGDTLVNRIETDTSPRLTRGPYDVSLWARWQRGGNLLIAHGEFTSGTYCCSSGPSTNISGNALASRFHLTIPRNLGTPGAENSARRRLRQLTGSDNLGPVISEVRHVPPSPAAGVPVRILARASDADGVESLRVFYRQGAADGPFDEVSLRDDGRGGDGLAGDGLYGGELPAFSLGTRVVFYVEATDGQGVSRRFPEDAPSRTCLFLVAGDLSQPLDTYQLVLDEVRTRELQTRQLHSNDLLDATFVFNNERVYYNVGVRYRGSPWGRPGRNNFRVRFPEDDRFHRGLTEINLSSRAPSGREGAAYFLVGRTGTAGRPVATADNLYIRTYLNGSSLGTQAMIQPVNRVYIDRWYGSGGGGVVLKAVGRLAFNDSGERTAWDGANFIHRGESSENYRGYFTHSIQQEDDNWQPFYALTGVMDRRVTSDPIFDEEIGDFIDLDAFLRVLAVRILTADWDAFGVGNGHNGYLVLDPSDGRWDLLPFDMDNAWGNATPTLFPAGDADVARMLRRPPVHRAYFRVLWEMVGGYWNDTAPAGFLDAVQRATGIDMGGFKAFLRTSASHVRTQVLSSTTVPFRVLTNGGEDFATETPAVEIEGEAPVGVESILFRRGGGDLLPLVPRWSTPTRWKADFELPEAENLFAFLGFDSAGNLAGSGTIAVTNLLLSDKPHVTSWFPDSGPATGGTVVTFSGRHLEGVVQVLFGGAEATEVTVLASGSVQVLAPPAAPPLEGGGTVDVEFRFLGGELLVISGAFTYHGEPRGFVRGDANGDGWADLADAVAVLGFLFRGSATVGCEDSGDVNDDGRLGLTDAIDLLSFLFRGGAPPAPPYPSPGRDPTPDGFTCGD